MKLLMILAASVMSAVLVLPTVSQAEVHAMPAQVAAAVDDAQLAA